MILIALMWARIPSGPDNFKRVIQYQTLGTSFHGGFESVANIVFSFETKLMRAMSLYLQHVRCILNFVGTSFEIFSIMILIALMWARITSGPDNFKRVIQYQT